MTLWNIIRDFFVRYFFGGAASDFTQYRNVLGTIYNGNGQGLGVTSTSAFINSPLAYISGIDNPYYMSIGDWLSTTATIITLFALVFVLFLLARWVFRIVVNAFQMR